jgi:hypothetical protein
VGGILRAINLIVFLFLFNIFNRLNKKQISINYIAPKLELTPPNYNQLRSYFEQKEQKKY